MKVMTNVLVRELDLSPIDNRLDGRRLVDGLKAFGGAQLIDTTLVCAFQATCCGGVALQAARAAKSVPTRVGGEGGRARLVVLAADVGGRWSG